jgi:hypothetical protein
MGRTPNRHPDAIFLQRHASRRRPHRLLQRPPQDLPRLSKVVDYEEFGNDLQRDHCVVVDAFPAAMTSCLVVARQSPAVHASGTISFSIHDRPAPRAQLAAAMTSCHGGGSYGVAKCHGSGSYGVASRRVFSIVARQSPAESNGPRPPIASGTTPLPRSHP